MFVKPFLTRCPPAYLQTAFSEFLPAYFTFIGRKLEVEWSNFAKYDFFFFLLFFSSSLHPPSSNPHFFFSFSFLFQRIAQSKQGDEEQETESAEIIAEKILRDLTRGISEILLAMFNPRNALDGVAAEALNRTQAADGTTPGGGSFRNTKELVAFVLSRSELASPVMQTIIQSFAWKDTLHIRRAVAVCFSLVPQVAGNESFTSLIADALLTSALQNLTEGYFQEVHSDVLTLITLIYERYRPANELPLHVFLKLPNMTPARLQQFDESFTKEKAEKKHRMMMKTFLQDITGKNVGSWFKTKVSILNLPEKLFINRVEREMSLDEAPNADVNLTALFSLSGGDS